MTIGLDSVGLIAEDPELEKSKSYCLFVVCFRSSDVNEVSCDGDGISLVQFFLS